MNTKVRLVRCPRCRKVLPELAEVPVYKCGGCGAVLQAKNSKNDSKDSASRVVETDPKQKLKLEHASEDNEASSSNQQSTILSNEEPDKNNDQNESRDDTREHLGYMNYYFDEARSSTELSSHENAESSPDPLGQYDRKEQNECGDSDREQLRDINVSNDIYSSSELKRHANESSPAQIDVDEHTCSLEQENGRDRNEFGDSSRELPASINCFEEKSSSAELSCREVEEASHVAGADTEVNENLESSSTFRSLVAENLLDARPRKSAITSPRPVDEDINLQRFERVSSVDTLENVPFNHPSSDFIVSLGDMSKSPTHRSYYGYEGSVSSFDGNDDQVTDLHLLPPKRGFVVSSKGFPKRNVMRLETDEHRSRLPLYSRGPRAVHGNASPSSLGLNEFQYRSTYHLPAKTDNPESEKKELLRMVHELQDQLNRMNISNGKASGGFSARVAKKEKLISSYYDHLAAEREMYHNLNYPRYPEKYGQGRSWSQQGRPPRMAFSGEAAYNRSQVDCSCFHCCPQERHFSVQLPPQVICRIKGHYGAHPSHGYYSPYRSGPSSPQHHSGSEFSLWSHEPKSDDQRHGKDREAKKLYLWEKHQHHSSKRHFRPIAGGAPLIACYQCSELLQLPADFLLFKRRYHSLRCSACSQILKFSLQNKTRIVQYVPEARAPPSSEVDDYADPIKESRSASRASYGPHTEPVSCSDDYGQSFRKSYSTETDHFSLAIPFHTLNRNSNYRKMSSGSSFEPVEDRKAVLKDSRNRYKNPVQTLDSAGPSSLMSKREKISSEIEEIPPTSGSPLHRLMGYSSPSKVMRG